jgi:glycolate oxidase FAD binding subunit
MDRADEIVAAVCSARVEGRRLLCAGTSSKRDWRRAETGGEMLSLEEHVGVEDYQPAELVMTARAGTPLKEIEQTLAQHGQMLAFEPPQYYGSGTIGGAVAAGLSGPNRPWGGATRDAVLGVEMVNGRGQRLRFGGQVMKNVAGYDLSRLQAGAFGSLGALLSASVRVQPIWESSTTVHLDLDAASALDCVRRVAQRALPLAGTCWTDGVLSFRLGGDSAAVQRAQASIGGDMDAQSPLWGQLRDHRHEFFKATDVARDRYDQSLWRVSTPPSAPLPECAPQDVLVEWGGGLRWLWHDEPEYVAGYAARVGGWAWRRGDAPALPPDQLKYMRALRDAFDPEQVFATPLYLSDAD